MGGAFTGRRRAVMTTGTGTGHPGVIKIHRSPVGGDMAIVAGIRALDMSRVLAGGGGAVMTTRTGAGDTGVIKIHRSPVGGDVATITLR